MPCCAADRHEGCEEGTILYFEVTITKRLLGGQANLYIGLGSHLNMTRSRGTFIEHLGFSGESKDGTSLDLSSWSEDKPWPIETPTKGMDFYEIKEDRHGDIWSKETLQKDSTGEGKHATITNSTGDTLKLKEIAWPCNKRFGVTVSADFFASALCIVLCRRRKME
jgi:hypothetical protein